MAWFEYKAKDGRGQIQAGNLEASSYQEAHGLLRQRALQVVLLRSCAQPTAAKTLSDAGARSSVSKEAPLSLEQGKPGRYDTSGQSKTSSGKYPSLSGFRWQPQFSLGWDLAGLLLLVAACAVFFVAGKPWGPGQALGGKSRSLTVQGRLDYSAWKIPPKSVRLDVVLPDVPANFSTILVLKGGVSSFSQRVDYVSVDSPTSAKIEISGARQRVLHKTVALTDSLEKVELGTCSLIYRKPTRRK